MSKRIPKRKNSCCSSCTSYCEDKGRSQKRHTKNRKVCNTNEEQLEDPQWIPRSTRKTSLVYDEETMLLPVEWLSDTSVLDKTHILAKPQADFELFLNHVDAKKDLNDVAGEDLISLVENNNVKLGVIAKIKNMLNAEFSNSFCVHFNYYIANEKETTRVVKTKFPISRLIMFLDVNRDEDGYTYLAKIDDVDRESHFTLAVFDFESLTLIYGDTLGWDIPIQFLDKLKQLLLSIECPTVFHILSCHPAIDDDIHTCTRECSPLYPLQTCDSISGVAVIISMVIACMNYDVYLSLAMGLDTKENACFRYLQHISDHSKLLRLVIITWIINSCLDYREICVVSVDKFEIGSGQVNKINRIHESKSISVHIKTELGGDVSNESRINSFLSTDLDDYIATRPTVHFCKPEHFRLKLTMHDGRSLYKMFKCKGKGDQAAMRVITEFLNSNKVIEWLKSRIMEKCSLIPSTRMRKNKTCNILDFPDEVQAYFIKNPELSFEKKIRFLILRMYIEGCASVVTKRFKCSTAGKNDDIAIKKINAYLKTPQFRDLIKRSANRESHVTEEDLIKSSFEELVLKKPSIHYIKEKNILKIECQLKTGKRIYRGFSCSDAGKKDATAMAAIHKFIKSDEALEWVCNKYRNKSVRKKINKVKITPKPVKDEAWLFGGELHVGNEVKSFFDDIDFDFRKRMVMAKGVNSHYEGNAIITKNEKWGKTHRFDETYEIVESMVTEKDVFPAVTMYISCSSKSLQCKAQCGTPLKDLANTAIGTECPGCQSALEFVSKECVNCTINSTPKWYSINGAIMCSACYQYQQKHNEARPTDLKMKSIQGVSRLYHPHFVCGWRLKLVIYSNDLNTWRLFKHKDNAKFHSDELEESEKEADTAVLVSKSPKVNKNKESKSILCNRCISEHSSVPFVCTSQEELIRHISEYHSMNFMNCATCWSESGSVINFEKEIQLQQHIQDSHRGEQPCIADIARDTTQDLEETEQVELDEAVIALLEPNSM